MEANISSIDQLSSGAEILLCDRATARQYAQESRVLSEKSGQRLSIVSITLMEVMEGVASKAHQAACKSILTRFDFLLSAADQQWAMQQLERLQFSCLSARMTA